ncbi:MAG: phage holin family protein [Deltaproteobacteria bacterium]|nr:MAG: phage holin family protein [Deltaproteobacteria bacterium]
MTGFLLRMAISAFALWVASAIVPGMVISGTPTLLAAALLLGLVNAVVRPLALLLTLPFTIVTLGLFILVVNAGMLGLVAALLDGFTLSGFGSALLGSLIVSFVSAAVSWTIGPSGRFEVMVIEHR